MTREEAIEYWEQFNAEIDDLYDACSDAERDVLVKQREIVEYTISALRQQEQENECVECSGIVYRQTNSGKIIPLGQRCGAKITPPCYVPDGDGCSYQIYGDNNDEPIDRCKSCPLCQSDKVRHKQEHFHDLTKKVEPLTMEELRRMEGQPVYIVENTEYWAIVNSFDQAGVYLLSYGNPDDYGYFGFYGKTWLAYRQKKEV